MNFPKSKLNPVHGSTVFSVFTKKIFADFADPKMKSDTFLGKVEYIFRNFEQISITYRFKITLEISTLTNIVY